jgi:homoserine dehydrogenase
VLAQIAHILGESDVSIAAVVQKEDDKDTRTADLVIMTHRAKETAMRAALGQIERLPVVAGVRSFLRVEG